MGKCLIPQQQTSSRLKNAMRTKPIWQWGEHYDSRPGARSWTYRGIGSARYAPNRVPLTTIARQPSTTPWPVHSSRSVYGKHLHRLEQRAQAGMTCW